MYTEYYHVEDGDTLSYVFIPNSFTPDGDGRNDFFNIILNAFYIDSAEIFIYNLNGEIISRTNPFQGYVWDGRYKGLKCEVNKYNWYLKAKDTSGYWVKLNGSVQLLK